MQRYEISLYFEIGPRQNWFISLFLWLCSLWCSADSCGQIYFITLWIFVFISAHLSIKHHIFRTLPTLDNRYQTHKRTIMKFCLLIPKHLVIQLAKLQIDIVNFKTTFWHCPKNSDYFWTRVYMDFPLIRGTSYGQLSIALEPIRHENLVLSVHKMFSLLLQNKIPQLIWTPSLCTYWVDIGPIQVASCQILVNDGNVTDMTRLWSVYFCST